jgi:hypothetical protein
MFVVIARWFMHLDVIFVISGVPYTVMTDDELGKSVYSTYML